MVKKVFYIMLIIVCTFIVAILGINATIVASNSDKIIGNEEAKTKNVDCILVLGASVYSNNTPSPMLEDRLLKSLELYNEGVSKRLLMSGDHREDDYNEVGVMKHYVVTNGALSKDVFMDHYGINTYESLYRAKHIFKVKKLIIVTQEYHLYRALYIAKKLDLEAYGVASDVIIYKDQKKRDIREFFARIKAFFTTSIKAEKKPNEKEIPITGNGDDTNTK